MKVRILNIGIRIIKMICFLFGVAGLMLLFLPGLIYWVLTGIDLIDKYVEFVCELKIKEITKK